MRLHRSHHLDRSGFLDRSHLGPLIALLLGAVLLSATAMASVYAAGGGPTIDLPEAADHGRAGQDHSPPHTPTASAQNEADHGQSDDDHGRSGADHGQADGDHGQAGDAGAAASDADHGQSQESHGHADADHGQAGADHGQPDNPQANAPSGGPDGEHGKSGDAPGRNKEADPDAGAGDAQSHQSEGEPLAKVELCHRPPGDPANARTLSVNGHAADAHLAHGDSLGDC